MEIECTPFSIRETVETVLGLFGDKARQKNLELAAIVQDAVPGTLVGDSVRVRQILINLVSNALKVGVCCSLRISLDTGILHSR
jgi:two-component system sensor histidine kinase BarA